MSEENEETPLLKARVSTIEGRIGALRIMQEEVREGIGLLIDKVQAVISKRAGDTAVRKGLDIGTEYGPTSPRNSLEGAVLSRLLSPSTVLNNGHDPED